jgi:hypothetical protein
MHASVELLSRGEFTDRLGLTDDDLSRLPCSAVADAITTFYDVEGNALGEFKREMHPFLEEDIESYIIYGELLTEPAGGKLLLP